VLEWQFLLCSTAIDCCSTFRHKLLETERSVTSNTVMMEEQIIGHSSGICLRTASCKQPSPTVQVSVYTQLHVINCQPQFKSLSTHKIWQLNVNFFLSSLFKNSSDFSSIDVTPSILRRWLIVRVDWKIWSLFGGVIVQQVALWCVRVCLCVYVCVSIFVCLRVSIVWLWAGGIKWLLF